MKHIVITFACLLLTGTAVAGAVYQGIDKNGRTYFSDRPLHAETEKKVQVRFAKAATPAPKAAAETGEDDAEIVSSNAPKIDRVAEKREERVRSQNEQARFDENCSRAKSALAGLEKEPRLYQVLDDGGRRYYSAKERNTMLKNAQADIQRWCS